VCLECDKGGLGVRRVKEFNVSLVGKWWWRSLVANEGLWYKTLVAKYGEEEGMPKKDGGLTLVWWKDLWSVCWFNNNVSMVVDYGESSLF
jgi:hypothetical protein